MVEERRLALDIGNVLFHVNVNKFVDRFNEVTGETHGMAFLEGIQAGQDIGLYNMRQAVARFYPGISEEKLDLLSLAWNDTAVSSGNILWYVSGLIDAGWEVALLSNIGFDHKIVISNLLPSNFDRTIKHFSCDVGARKPSQLFYLSFCIKHPDWINSLFLDDREENISSANDFLYAKRFNLDDYESDWDALEGFKKIIHDDNNHKQHGNIKKQFQSLISFLKK